MQDYKQLNVWLKAHELTLQVYKVSKDFPKDELYGLTSQLRRAASSIPANIAEGAGKKSQPDFANFLNVALGSANETEYFLILAKDLKYLDEQTFLPLADLVNKIKAMLINLISKVRVTKTR